jgi:hypothetical protein
MNIHNLYKLSTKEDPIHLHKILGGICLAHYAYRYYLLFTIGSMELYTPFAYYMVGVHGLLSCSSIIFHIPAKRIQSKPMIYPEYRLHSIVFALRSVVCYYLRYHCFSLSWNVAVCFVTMLMADFVSILYPSNTTTMRHMPFDGIIDQEERQRIIIAQSSHQIGATLFMLGNKEYCFSPMFAIQFSAFLMTLVRKSIISANGWHLMYNFSLWINILCYITLPIDYIVYQIVLTQLFYYWRSYRSIGDNNITYMFCGNKYVGWAGVFTLFFYGRRLYDAFTVFDIGLFLGINFENESSKVVFRLIAMILYSVYMIKINSALFMYRRK